MLRFGTDGKWLPNYCRRLDRNHPRQNTGEIGVQGAASIGQSPAVIVVVMRLAAIGVVLRMISVALHMMMLVRCCGCRKRRRSRARG